MCLYRDCTKRVLGGRELSFQGAEIEKKKINLVETEIEK